MCNVVAAYSITNYGSVEKSTPMETSRANSLILATFTTCGNKNKKLCTNFSEHWE